MLLVGLFLIVLAGAFILQAFGVGGERLFDVVWPLLVLLIGVGFINESRQKDDCPVCEHKQHEEEEEAEGEESTKEDQSVVGN